MAKKNPQYELQRRQHKHEERMRILEVMAADPEMKYFLGVALGGATGALGKVLGQTLTGGGNAQTEEPTGDAPWGWIISGASPYTLPLGILEVGGTSATSGSTGMFGFVPNILTLGGTGFAGFCGAVLLLKAIFGDEDVASLMNGLGTVADAAMPL